MIYDEYDPYVDRIIALDKNYETIKSEIIKILSINMGLEYSEENENDVSYVNNIVNEILDIFEENRQIILE